MSIRILACFMMICSLAVTTGCATKITLGPISDDLKPSAKLTGKVHVMPLVDGSRVTKLDNNYYTTVTGWTDTKYISESKPAEMLEQSIIGCLKGAGLTVSTGDKVPEDSQLVLAPDFKMLYIGTDWGSVGITMAVTAVTGVASTTDPYAQIVVLNGMEDSKSHAKTAALFNGWERSILHLTKGGGAERSFRLVEEKYCGWLQRKVASFMADPAAADAVNKKELLAMKKK